MKEEPKNQFTTNPHTHYILQFKNKYRTWIHEWANGGVKYYSDLEAATRDMEEIFRTGMDEASVIEWKKEIKVFKKKQEPVTQKRTAFDVEVLHTDGPKVTPHWYVRRGNLETYDDAREYIKENTKHRLFAEKFRIRKREETTTITILD